MAVEFPFDTVTHNREKSLCVLQINHLAPCELSQVAEGLFQVFLVGLREENAEKWLSSAKAEPDGLLMFWESGGVLLTPMCDRNRELFLLTFWQKRVVKACRNGRGFVPRRQGT